MRMVAAPLASVRRRAIPAVFGRVDADPDRAHLQAYATLHERAAMAVVAVIIVVLRVRSGRAREKRGAGDGRKHEAFHVLFLRVSSTRWHMTAPTLAEKTPSPEGRSRIRMTSP